MLDPYKHQDPVEQFLLERVAAQKKAGAKDALPKMDISDKSLERLIQILTALNDPQEDLGTVVHLAGTNGKGSTLASLKAMAEAEGRKVNCLTSPYLINAHEQIRLNGHFISDGDLIDILDLVYKTAAKLSLPLTRFEAFTLAAFIAFRDNKADLVLLETGLGGRFDATNVIQNPALQIITPISFDHQDVLGNSLAQITREKAGILRPGGKAIVAPQNDIVKKELAAIAATLPSSLLLAGRDWRFRVRDDQLLVLDDQGGFTAPLPVLPGDHQIENAATAIVAARSLGHNRISDAAIRAGLGWVRWPARLQDLSSSALKDKAPKGAEIILDGGHNPAAGDRVSSFLKSKDLENKDVFIIAAMRKNKDAAAFFRQFVGLGHQVITVPLWQDDMGYDAADLASLISDLGMASVPARNCEGALERIKKTASKKDVIILITGSFRLAGETFLLAEEPIQ